VHSFNYTLPEAVHALAREAVLLTTTHWVLASSGCQEHTFMMQSLRGVHQGRLLAATSRPAPVLSRLMSGRPQAVHAQKPRVQVAVVSERLIIDSA
jgi:hypothetical protein